MTNLIFDMIYFLLFGCFRNLCMNSQMTTTTFKNEKKNKKKKDWVAITFKTCCKFMVKFWFIALGTDQHGVANIGLKSIIL